MPRSNQWILQMENIADAVINDIRHISRTHLTARQPIGPAKVSLSTDIGTTPVLGEIVTGPVFGPRG